MLLVVSSVVFVAVLVAIRFVRSHKQYDFSRQNTFFITGGASGWVLFFDNYLLNRIGIGKKMAERLLLLNQRVVAADINLKGMEVRYSIEVI